MKHESLTNVEGEMPEGSPTVVSGDYTIPKHPYWVEVDSKYLVDFSDVVISCQKKTSVSVKDARRQVLEILHRINNEEDSSNYVLGSILAQWADEIVEIFTKERKL